MAKDQKYLALGKLFTLVNMTMCTLRFNIPPFVSAPINPPVEVKVTRLSSWSISVWWRGVSTNQLEEPLEGYKVST